jgi:hypothetical protein
MGNSRGRTIWIRFWQGLYTGSQLLPSFYWHWRTDCICNISILLVLATVLGNPASVWVETGSETAVRVTNCKGTRTALYWRGCYPDRTSTRGFLGGLYPDHSSIECFLHHLLQLSIWVLIVSWHAQYVDYAALVALPPPAFRFAIRLIFVVWRWNKGPFYTKLAGFR